MGYWSYSALDGYNGQMIPGYVPQKMLASVKGVPSIVDDPDDHALRRFEQARVCAALRRNRQGHGGIIP